MSKFKHTPGKWKFTERPSPGYQYAIREVSSTEGITVCRIRTNNSEQAEANAKLIAAAPDMLVALESIQDVLYAPGLIYAGVLRRIVDEAIKKATE